ncbi:MAG: STAS domain-containing protein [Actinomycetota bacterium]|nr:STAS domain-containing protein [Actinomycetota bacterium]
MILLNVVDASTDGAALFRVTGEVDMSTARLLSDAITAADLIPGSDVSLDMSGVAFMDCAGVAALVDIRGAFYQLGIQLRIVNPSRAVERIITLCGLCDYFCFVYPLERASPDDLAKVVDLRREVPAQRS